MPSRLSATAPSDRRALRIEEFDGEDPMAHARAAAEKLKSLNLSAYGTSKERLRDADVEHVLELLKEELPFKGV